MTKAARERRPVEIREGYKPGAGEGTRTPDPIITNDVLYQLSYTGIRLCAADSSFTGRGEEGMGDFFTPPRPFGPGL